MGRTATVNINLPVRMRMRVRAYGTYYFYDTGGKPRKEIPLGSDYTKAVARWCELEIAYSARSKSVTFKDVTDLYVRDVLPRKAARTAKDNLTELNKLLEFFNDPPIPFESLEPVHVSKYMKWRGQTAPVRANREKALLSHIWNYARTEGITSKTNPCQGIKGFTEKGRHVYTEDEVFDAVYEAADRAVKDAMDLAYVCAQRPADTLKMYETDIKDGGLYVQQGKTKHKLRFTIEADLETILNRITEFKKTLKVRTLALVCTDSGSPLSYNALRSRIDKARIAAAKKRPQLADAIAEFQFRDLRAKGGTDKTNDDGDIRAAQKVLGHSNQKTTEIYVRNRVGDTVSPLKKRSAKVI
jgi:integrase